MRVCWQVQDVSEKVAETKEEEPPKNGESEAAHSKHDPFDAGSYGFFGGAHLLSFPCVKIRQTYKHLISTVFRTRHNLWNQATPLDLLR